MWPSLSLCPNLLQWITEIFPSKFLPPPYSPQPQLVPAPNSSQPLPPHPSLQLIQAPSSSRLPLKTQAVPAGEAGRLTAGLPLSLSFSLLTPPAVTSPLQTFSSKLPLHSLCYPSPQFKQAFPENKLSREASRPGKQEYKLQIFTLPSLFHIQSPALSRPPAVASPYSLTPFPED